jgi:capsular polysaccharide biosynthesis protein
MIEKIVSSEIFPSHSIAYAVPENFNEAHRWLFYEENFSYEISAIHQITLNNIAICNALVFQDNRPISGLTRHKRPALMDFFRTAIKLKVSKRDTLDKGILGLQDWANNYFHWMTEILPRIVAISHKQPSVPVVIPSNYLNYPFIVESLDLLKIDVKTFDVRGVLKIDRLYASAVPHVGRFNEGLMHFFRDKILGGTASHVHPFRCIYITRGKARRRRISNEEAVFELLEKKGFEKIVLEDLKLKDQVKIFQEARVVVASHGAGLTNSMFMQKGQTIIELKSDNNNYWCYFSLARVFGLKYYYSLNKGSSANHRDADIILDIAQLQKLVTQAMGN